MPKYFAELGREKELSLAELQAVFEQAEATSEGAIFTSDITPDVDRLGGTIKIGELKWRNLDEAARELGNAPEGKLTVGISDYRKGANPKKALSLGLELKRKLGRSTRLVPNKTAILTSAVSFHNQLDRGDKHFELMVTNSGVARLIGVQNLDAYVARDQKRPARDAKNGMLPLRLAQMLVNLTGKASGRLLDPFCGTGVILQEAGRIGFSLYGTDINPKMIEHTKTNLNWAHLTAELSEGDATRFKWAAPIDTVATEMWLGPPLSRPVPPPRQQEIEREVEQVLLGFLNNLAPQIAPQTPIVIAAPFWRTTAGDKKMDIKLPATCTLHSRLSYARPDQIVGRDILVLTRV